MKGRLLMVTGDSVAAAGIEGAFSATLRGFALFWERIDIVCPHIKGGAASGSLPNVFFHSIGPFRIFAPVYIFMRGLSLGRAHRPSLIVAHAYGPQLMACGAWLLAKATDIPLVLEVHHIDGYPNAANSKERIFRIISMLFFRIAGKDVALFRAVSAEGADGLRALGIPASKIKIIHAMYIDHAIFRPIDGIVKEYDMVFVGRLASNKGLDRLLAVFMAVSGELPAARLLIVGSGPYGAWLAKRIAGKRNIVHIPRVRLVGDVAALYNRSRVAVCMSLSEGGPRFTVEAMACGIPVVSTGVGLMKEIVHDGENGFLVSPYSAQAVADRILRILRSGSGYSEYSAQAVRTAARFEYREGITAYARVYYELIRI